MERAAGEQGEDRGRSEGALLQEKETERSLNSNDDQLRVIIFYPTTTGTTWPSPGHRLTAATYYGNQRCDCRLCSVEGQSGLNRTTVANRIMRFACRVHWFAGCVHWPRILHLTRFATNSPERWSAVHAPSQMKKP